MVSIKRPELPNERIESYHQLPVGLALRVAVAHGRPDGFKSDES